MNNFQNPGWTMTFTAPAGGVVSGTAYLIGAKLVVAAITVAAGLPFEGATFGVFWLPKIAGVAWAEGAVLYWDNTAAAVGTVVGASTRRIGYAAAAQLSADTTGSVKLIDVPTLANVA